MQHREHNTGKNPQNSSVVKDIKRKNVSFELEDANSDDDDDEDEDNGNDEDDFDEDEEEIEEVERGP